MSTSNGDPPLLAVEDLRTHITTDGHTIHAVDGLSFTIESGEVVGLVGESGSGKSVTCTSLTGLVPQPPAKLVDGRIEYYGQQLHGADEPTLRTIRGNHIAHVFQNPRQSLNPVYAVGEQLVEAITIHNDVTERAARAEAIGLLRRVGIPQAERRLDDYPHEFSGGMAQRVAIAIALAAEPNLLIADEPTTSVDVTVQSRLIELLRELTAEGMGLLLVTHDFRVVAALADRVLVMFGGTIVERGPTEQVFERPAHPYTQSLFESYARIGRRADRYARDEIPTTGCRFRKECPFAIERCADPGQPPFHELAHWTEHAVSCVHFGPGGDPADILEGANAVRPVGGDEHG